jgi:hypothetical protein
VLWPWLELGLLTTHVYSPAAPPRLPEKTGVDPSLRNISVQSKVRMLRGWVPWPRHPAWASAPCKEARLNRCSKRTCKRACVSATAMRLGRLQPMSDSARKVAAGLQTCWICWKRQCSCPSRVRQLTKNKRDGCKRNGGIRQ